MWGDIAITFLLAFVTAFVGTPYTIKLAHKVGAIDKPSKRRINKVPVPRLGGIAIIVGFILSVTFVIISLLYEKKLFPNDSNKYIQKVIIFIFCVILLGIFAYIDDVKKLKAWQKLIVQILVAVILYFGEIKINQIGTFILPEPISFILTMLWIVGIINSVNLIDGLDGLSSGTTLISSFFLLIIFATNGSSMISVMLITALAGGITGFLPYNLHPAKTFVGDVGSQFYGLALAVISILGTAKTATIVVLIAPIFVLGVPIFDTLFAIIRRVKNGKSIKAILQPDKGHIHHRLIGKGYNQKQAVAILYAIVTALGMFTIIFIYDGLEKAIAFGLVFGIVLWFGRKELKKYNSKLINSNIEKKEGDNGK